MLTAKDLILPVPQKFKLFKPFKPFKLFTVIGQFRTTQLGG
jgi:hypothetical protein